MRLSFAKYEGLGNDFLVVEVVEAQPGLALGPAQVQHLCDRHRGVGGDGVLLVTHDASRARMDVINADGSVPEMCGNGIRCVALHLHRTGRVQDGAFELDTAAGVHVCRVLRGGEHGLVEVSMRAPSLAPDELGLAAQAPWVDAAVQVGDATLHLTAVSMGNPHAVTFDDVGAQQAALGPLLERDPRFARGVNAGFARMQDAQHLTLAVYERGAGWTQACGTGACAAAVAAVETGRAARGTPLVVQLPGGPLTIVVGPAGARLTMTGPATHVFDGAVELP